MARILILEDHDSIRDGVAAYLRREGHEVEARPDARDWDQLVGRFDLYIFDVLLPEGNGLALARSLRSVSDAPFLFLTARSDEADRLAGWETGAADYVVKPFSVQELVHRVRSILGRRVPARRRLVLSGAELLLDLAGRWVEADGRTVDLTAGEWSFLEALTARPGEVLSRKDLMSRALDYYVDTGERTVDTHIKNLRAKLGHPGWIETVRSVGYRFAGEPL